MKNVIMMGFLFRVSDANFKRFLQATAEGNGAAGDYLGHDLGRVYQVTDMGKSEAKDLLEELMRKK